MASFSMTGGATLDQLAHCGMLPVEIVSEKVESRSEALRDELDSEHRVYPRTSAGNVESMRALDGVVVGQNERAVANLFGERSELLGGINSIRICGVKMAIGKHGITCPCFLLHYIT